jgi:hypothetical protein
VKLKKNLELPEGRHEKSKTAFIILSFSVVPVRADMLLNFEQLECYRS